MSDATSILSEIESGDPQASEQLLPLVYEELRKIAAQTGWTEPSSAAASVSSPELDSIAFSPDSAIPAVGLKSGAISLVEVPTGRILAQLDDPNQDIPSSLAFSPDGALLAAASEFSQTIHVWDPASIRRQLDALNLDWNLPAYPARSNPANRRPLKLTIDTAMSK
jgi:WD40 repeat protein